MTETIALKFTPTKDDYARASRCLLLSKPWPWLVLIGAGLIGVCNVIAQLATGSGWSPWMWILPLPVAMAAFYLFVWVPMSAARLAGKQERLTCEMTWHVNDDGILMQNKFGESRVDWGTFHRFKETRGLFILVYTTTEQMGQFVPKRAFESPEQEAAFREMLRRNIKGPKAGVGPKTTAA